MKKYKKQSSVLNVRILLLFGSSQKVSKEKQQLQNPHISAVVCDLYLQRRGAGGGGDYIAGSHIKLQQQSPFSHTPVHRTRVLPACLWVGGGRTAWHKMRSAKNWRRSSAEGPCTSTTSPPDSLNSIFSYWQTKTGTWFKWWPRCHNTPFVSL